MDGTTQIRTARMLLRPLEPTDLQGVEAVLSDPRTVGYNVDDPTGPFEKPDLDAAKTNPGDGDAEEAAAAHRRRK